MKHRPFIFVAVAAIPFAVAAAQTPPTPPPVSAEPVVVASPARPIAPMAPAAPMPHLSGQMRHLDLDEVRRSAEDAKWAAQDAVRGLDMARISLDAKRAAQDAVRGIDFGHIADEAMFAARGAAGVYAPLAPRQSSSQYSSSFSYSSQGGEYRWIQGDAADSIYQIGREAFNRQDYSRAATRFAEVLAKYPNFRRATDAAYYEAFSRYRIGTVDQLRLALKVLEAYSGRLAYDPQGNQATILQARVLRALVERNEPGADARLKDLYARYPSATCDSERNSIKSQVLNSLYQSDPDAATPYIRDYLATRDACNADLRKTSVFLLASRPTDQNTALIVGVARNDTVREVRTQAIEVLSKMPGDAAITALQELMRDNDERVQRAAVRSLMRSDNVKARSALRSSLLDRKDATENQRIEAIQSYDRENTTPDDAAYLRNLYNRKDESDRIKEAVISVLSRVPSDENVAFLLNIARNSNESSSLRARALRSISRTALSVEDLVKLYDASDSRSMRQSLVEQLSNRKEEAAVNKLLEIVKYSTDPEVRKYTIQILLNKNDQTITKKVLDLIK